MSVASPGVSKLTGLFAVLILCMSEIHATPVLLESGWQEARIQDVRKARDVMNKGREKKRLAALQEVEVEVQHSPRKRLKRQRR